MPENKCHCSVSCDGTYLAILLHLAFRPVAGWNQESVEWSIC